MREEAGLDRRHGVGMIDQELLRVLSALTDALAGEGEPRAALLDDVHLRREIDEVALFRDALTVEDVQLDLLERRRHLVLHDLHARAVADDVLFLLEGADATDVEANRGVELERVAARRRLGAAE